MLLLIIILCWFPAVKAKSDCSILHDEKYKGLAANCKDKKLRAVPSDLPRSIVLLQIDGNELDQLPANCFKDYPELKELDVSENDISRFENESFNGLSRLITLKVWRNRISMDSDTFPSNVFKPLRSLQHLYLNDSKIESKQGDFPDDAFKNLIHLKELSMDTWPGPDHRTGMGNLKSLESLRIVGSATCHMTHIDNSTFAVLENIPIIYLYLWCFTVQIETDALWPFNNLQLLELHTTYSSSLTLSKVTSLFKPLVDNHMVKVDLSGLQVIRDQSAIDRELNKKTMSYLLDICVEKINLSHNRLTTIYSNIIEDGLLCKCVKYIDLSHNHITSQKSVSFYMIYLENLEYLDLSDNYGSFSTNAGITNYGGLDFQCPPKLQQLLLHHFGHSNKVFNGNITFSNCSNLFKVDMSQTGYYEFGGYIRGLSELRYLDISHNTVSESVFSKVDMVDKLETLIAQGTTMNFNFMRSEAFLSMKKLRILDLSLTDLQTILPDSFTKLPELRFLILRGNKFDNIPNELTQINSLQHLDLSNNALQTIPSDTRNKLDDLNKNRNFFQLNIEGNMFLCSCGTLDFIAWVIETEVSLGDNRNYSCIKDDGTMSDTESFYNSYLKEWRKCTCKTWLFMSIIGLFLLLLSLTLAFVIEKYLPKIEYFVLTTLGYVTEELPCRKNCKYDGYICYDDKSYSWPVHHLLPNLKRLDSKVRLYLPDLHETVGGVKAESIIEAIRSSWKVVIIISEDSFADEWFYYSVLSAVRLFSTSTITGRIILLYQDDIPEVRARTPQFLVNIVSQQNVFSVENSYVFWQQLHRLIMEERGPDVLF